VLEINIDLIMNGNYFWLALLKMSDAIWPEKFYGDL